MKVYTHFSFLGFSNTYLIGPAGGGDAIIIDPGIMDISLLRIIENNRYHIRHILITHNHETHTGGGKTLLKIYNASVYGSAYRLLDQESNFVQDGDTIDLNGIDVECIEVSGHSSDSLVYRIGSCYFTGDVLFAGSIGSTPNRYAKALLINSLKEKILSRQTGSIYPGHGPPSTIEMESRFNPYLI